MIQTRKLTAVLALLALAGLILTLERTRLGALSLVVAVVVGSAIVVISSPCTTLKAPTGAVHPASSAANRRPTL